MASAHSDVRAARMCFYQEWERQTLDAFLLPLHDLGLLEREKTTFVRKAAEAVNRLDWETYTTTCRTFMMLAEDGDDADEEDDGYEWAEWKSGLCRPYRESVREAPEVLQ